MWRGKWPNIKVHCVLKVNTTLLFRKRTVILGKEATEVFESLTPLYEQVHHLPFPLNITWTHYLCVVRFFWGRRTYVETAGNYQCLEGRSDGLKEMLLFGFGKNTEWVFDFAKGKLKCNIGKFGKWYKTALQNNTNVLHHGQCCISAKFMMMVVVMKAELQRSWVAGTPGWGGPCSPHHEHGTGTPDTGMFHFQLGAFISCIPIPLVFAGLEDFRERPGWIHSWRHSLKYILQVSTSQYNFKVVNNICYPLTVKTWKDKNGR